MEDTSGKDLEALSTLRTELSLSTTIPQYKYPAPRRVLTPALSVQDHKNYYCLA